MIKKLNKNRIYHFIGIGGIGMSAIAEMLVNIGFQVSGSDIKESYITDKLKEMGVKIYQGHSEKNVKDASFVVYSSAIQADNPEYSFAQKNKIPLVKRAEMLAELMKLRRGVAIGGTHGKTTTTSILATLLSAHSEGVSYIIGGVVKNLGGHSFLGDGEYLVAEADESDGSFLELTPEVCLITNIDDDHMNYYQTRRNLEDNFLRFINRVPFYGFCVLNGDDPTINKLLEGVRRPYTTFGIENEDVDYKGKILSPKSEDGFFHFQVCHQKNSYPFAMSLGGVHNIYNALGAIATAHKLGYNWGELQRALPLFHGVSRRLELILKNEHWEIYDDYAHHPTEIKAVIKSQVAQGKKPYIIFQPHRYSRTQEKWADFSGCFKGAKKVFLLPIYSANESPIEGISSEELVKEIRKLKVDGEFLESISLLKNRLPIQEKPIHLLSLGAGSISRQIRIFARELDR